MSRNAARSVDDVIVEPGLSPKRRSAADEIQALLSLSEVMAQAPERAVQRLTESAMELTALDALQVRSRKGKPAAGRA